MSTSRRVTMPEALDLTSTFVMGWTLPVATTERAISASSALPSCEGSNLVVLPRAATAMPRATAATRTTRPVQSQILRLFFRCVAKGCSHFFWLVSRLGVWLRKKMLRGSIDGGESCRKDVKLVPAPILDVRVVERNSNFGECYIQILCVFPQDAQNLSLDADVG